VSLAGGVVVALELVAGVAVWSVDAVLVDVRVVLLQPVRASPMTRVENSSVFFMGDVELLGD
jgi:hypothetical protein